MQGQLAEWFRRNSAKVDTPVQFRYCPLGRYAKSYPFPTMYWKIAELRLATEVGVYVAPSTFSLGVHSTERDPLTLLSGIAANGGPMVLKCFGSTSLCRRGRTGSTPVRTAHAPIV